MAKSKEAKKKLEKKAAENLVVASISTRGRTFEGVVMKKFPKRVEFERTVFIPKYERFIKKKTRIHARLPSELESQVNIGDYVQAQECRPLSKIIHFVVIKKLRSAENSKSEVKLP
jgi:small subunit ribosomal protein S17